MWMAVVLSPLSIASTPIQPRLYSLDFDVSKYTLTTQKVNGREITYRAFENIVYVAKPVDIRYESMNIYIPEAYFKGESINGYTKDTAPIFFPNAVGGYMPGRPMTPKLDQVSKVDAAGSPRGFGMGKPPGMEGQPPSGMGQPPQGRGEPPQNRVSSTQNKDAFGEVTEQPNAVLLALSKGLVVASPGARGRSNQDEQKKYIGKAPAAIVDLKAAVRYLHSNDAVMPGDANKIISNGTSAGGALSTLLGMTGNAADYEPYLDALGAAKASDDIFAVSAYCPITNLEHADMAYEWQFNGYDEYKVMNIQMLDYHVQRSMESGTLTVAQKQVSDDLAAQFPDYVNSLNLVDNQGRPLTLDRDGNGSFKRYVEFLIISSAQEAMAKGQDLSSYDFLTKQNGVVVGIDFAKYRVYAIRQKLPPAFDALDLSAGENNLFGNTNTDSQHFTDYSSSHSVMNGSRVNQEAVKLMNPMSYVDSGEAKKADHWRIRVGTNDRDTSLAISAILATKLHNMGYDVNYKLPWDLPHSGDYDLPELFDWITSITKH